MSEPRLITVQRRVNPADVPAAATLRAWAHAALQGTQAELTIRIVDEDESTDLNGRFRGKPYPTNVLSFTYDGEIPGQVGDDTPSLLGDLVICKAVVLREASEQQVTPQAHWAHMVVHGVLHLRGMDHQNDAEAAAMENLERDILAQLGFDDPYRGEAPDAACDDTRAPDASRQRDTGRAAS